MHNASFFTFLPFTFLLLIFSSYLCSQLTKKLTTIYEHENTFGSDELH